MYYRGVCRIALILVVFLTLILGIAYHNHLKDYYTVEPPRTETLVLAEQINTEMKNDLHLEDEHGARLQRYQDVCSVRKNSRPSYSYIYYYHNNATNDSLSMCSVPKAGCTFWARIYQFLNRTSKSRHVSSPLNITRYEIYYHPIIKLREMRYDDNKMANALRFFFVRDPYARLMSAYVDKFLLPQFLSWPSYGNRVARFRGVYNKTDPRCLTEKVTFEEFVTEIVFTGDWNAHWRPMHTVCDPCKLFPHFIGKQETFSKDVKYILSQVGLEDLMTKYSHKTYIVDEIKQLVDFTYAFRNIDRYLRRCYDNVATAERIWMAFQMNGYLAPDTVFPRTELENLLGNTTNTATVKYVVTKYFVNENARAGISRDQHSRQKRDMLVREYRTLSKDVMETLARMYDLDFKLFGYEKYPEDLFPWRYT